MKTLLLLLTLLNMNQAYAGSGEDYIISQIGPRALVCSSPERAFSFQNENDVLTVHAQNDQSDNRDSHDHPLGSNKRGKDFVREYRAVTG